MKKLVWITVFWTYLLMFWGNLVSATGSGLACPDWPTCQGTLIPPSRPDIVLEWGHRLLAAGAVIWILATAFQAWRLSKTNPLLRKLLQSLMAGLLILVGVQVVLGGVTVKLKLSLIVSTVHLVNANLIFAALILLACVATWDTQTIVTDEAKIKRLSVAGMAGLLIQLLLGAIVRHGHAGLACPNFPNCLQSFWPSPLTPYTAIAFVHRWWGFVMIGLFGHLMGAARRRAPRLRGLALVTGGLSLLQVLLGIATVLMVLDTRVRAAHAAIGYALWALLTVLAVRAGAFKKFWIESSSSVPS